MSLKYEPSSEPIHISAKYLDLRRGDGGLREDAISLYDLVALLTMRE